MTERAQTILTVAMSAYTAGWLTGLFVGGLAHRGWRRPMQPPRGSYGGSLRLDPGSVQRGNGNGAPATPKPDIIPKPQPPLGRIIDASGRTIGYQPLPWDGPINPPPRNP